MSKKAEDAAILALSEELLRILESQRQEGGNAYPPTLRRLAELYGGSHTDEQIVTAANKAMFTNKAVVTEKVNRKPTLDSPVYIKGDVPKKTKRAAPAKKPVVNLAELSERMLLVLESQRRLGAGAYPPTLRRLAELCELDGNDTRIPKIVGHESMVRRAVVVAKNKSKPNLDAPFVFQEDLEVDLSSVLPALLRFALKPALPGKSKQTESDAFTTTELANRFVNPLKKPFDDALNEGIRRKTLPPDVAWVLVKSKPYLFLLEKLRPGSSRATLPAEWIEVPPTLQPIESPARDFAGAFREAFDRLDQLNGVTNFVKLSDLRHALPEFGREAFDAGLRQLRIAGEFSLDSHEGLHGSLPPEDREAGVREAGSLLVYASRRS